MRLKAAIAIDDWKLSIFEEHLMRAGFQFEQQPGLGEGVILLTVKADCLNRLAVVIKEANAEAAAVKRSLQ